MLMAMSMSRTVEGTGSEMERARRTLVGAIYWTQTVAEKEMTLMASVSRAAGADVRVGTGAVEVVVGPEP